MNRIKIHTLIALAYLLLIGIVPARAADPAVVQGSPDPTVGENAAMLPASKQTTLSEEEIAKQKALMLKRPPKVVLATVGDKEITAEQLITFAAQNPQYLPWLKDNTQKSRVLKMLIQNALIDTEAEQGGYLAQVQEGDEPNKKDYYLAFQRMQREHFPLPPAPAEKDVVAYYEQHKAHWGIPESWHLQQVQVQVPKGAEQAVWDAAQVKAEAARARIVDGGEEFVAVAREMTDNPRHKASGGDLGFLPVTAYPWIRQNLANVPEGGVSQVIKSPVGYEFYRVVARREGLIPPLANIHDQVVAQMRQEQQIRARNAYLKQLAGKYPIEVKRPELASAAEVHVD